MNPVMENLKTILFLSDATNALLSSLLAPPALGGLFESAVSMVRPLADAKGIALELSGTSPQPRGDAEFVRWILGNLLSNAVKFSHAGGIVRLGAQADGERCRITVEDDGVDMDKKVLERLFRMETKLTTAGTGDEPGNGLGKETGL